MRWCPFRCNIFIALICSLCAISTLGVSVSEQTALAALARNNPTVPFRLVNTSLACEHPEFSPFLQCNTVGSIVSLCVLVSILARVGGVLNSFCLEIQVPSGTLSPYIFQRFRFSLR